jgi:site-specific DNA-methyltransferase (adenine-specific)
MEAEKLENIKLYNGDCMEVMKDIPDKSVDMVLCDLPYGVTQNKDDIMIAPIKLWEQYWRIAKPNAPIVLFGQDKFTAVMMLSDKNHKYNLIWDKVLTSGFLNANRMPLRSHEDIMVFYRKQPIYNPQKVKGKPNHSKGKPKEIVNNNYGAFDFVDNKEILGDMKHPKSILTFEKTHPSIAKHRTEKPIALLEWLINTYTNENMVVMDNTMGSGSTGVASLNLNRKFIGIEIDEQYFNIAKSRIETIVNNNQQKLF